jgi:hypothetical protein
MKNKYFTNLSIILLSTLSLLSGCSEQTKEVTTKFGNVVTLDDEYHQDTEQLMDALNNYTQQQQNRYNNIKFLKINKTKDLAGIEISISLLTNTPKDKGLVAKQMINELKGVFCSGRDIKIEPLQNTGRYIDYNLITTDNKLFTTITINKTFCETSDESLFEQHHAVFKFE